MPTAVHEARGQPLSPGRAMSRRRSIPSRIAPAQPHASQLALPDACEDARFYLLQNDLDRFLLVLFCFSFKPHRQHNIQLLDFS